MKEQLMFILGSVLFACVLTTAAMSDSNAAMKKCLDDYGYTPDKFHTFDFSKAAACHSDYRIAQTQIKNQELQAFLKKRPWYRGPNWAWEDRVELTCHKEFHTGVTYCHRPYELN